MYLFQRKIDKTYPNLNTIVEGNVCKKKSLFGANWKFRHLG